MEVKCGEVAQIIYNIVYRRYEESKVATYGRAYSSAYLNVLNDIKSLFMIEDIKETNSD